MIKGSLTASIQENHQFFSKSKLLASIGLSSFTKQSCSIIYNQNRKFLTSPIFNTLPQTLDAGETILDLYGPTAQGYTRFSKEAQQFESSQTQLVNPGLYALIDYHENVQLGITSNPDGTPFVRNQQYDQIILDINNSLERAVIWKINMLGEEVIIEIIFYDRGKRSNERKVALKDITIAAPPVSAFGQTYSSNSLSQQRSNIENFNTLNPIAREGEVSKSKFAQDSVAAPVQKFYDSNTGTWKFGNIQVLARMLQDVPPAPIGNIEGVSYNDPNTYLSLFNGAESGLAIPLSLQAGNPYLCGPCFVGCSDSEKKPKELPVTNRSLKSFKAGEVVMLTEINGEWIPQPFGEDKDFQSSAKFEDWAFVKLIANTDSYFKDDRYYTTGGTAYLTDIKPADYEKSSRIKFYTNVLTSWSNRQAFEQDGIQRPALTQIYNGDTLKQIQNLNIGNESDDFIPSKRYYVCSIFDQLKIDVGGFNEKTILVSTNVQGPNTFKDPAFKYAEEMPLFWGPVYVDGFSKFAYNPEGIHNNIGNFFGPVTDNSDSALQYFPRGDFLHVPAECGSLFINPFSVWKYWDQLGKSGFRIITPYINSPYYGTSTPVSKNKIQFSPLQAEFAGGDDTMSQFLTTPGYGSQREFFNIVRRLLNPKDGGFILGENYNDKLMGNTYERSKYFGYDEANLPITQQEIEKCPTIYDITKYNQATPLKTIRYQCYTKQLPVSAGGRILGSPLVFRTFPLSQTGAHCVGIISAKNTIGKPGGGKLNYSLIQDFGLNQQKTSTATQVTFSIVMGIAFGGSSGGIQTGIPQWGSDTDSISSFGTTALHVRIFDYWPEEQTIFDPRYFAVLHFNPGCYYNTENDNNDTLTIIDNENPAKTQKRVANSKKVDIPIPTHIGGKTVQYGEGIDGTTALLTKDQWKMNPIRRGALLTAGGFTYLYHVIGLPLSPPRITYGGTGFNQSFEHSISSRNLTMNVIVNNGQVAGILFKKDSLNNDMRGDNFLPSDFNMNEPKIDSSNGNVSGTTGSKGFILNIPSQTAGGKPAVLYFQNGQVWLKKAKDEAPVQHGPITRLSSSSKRGEGFIEETKDTSLDLGANSTGKYDCFYHFHNDITHTLILAQPFTAGFLQYVSMTIT